MSTERREKKRTIRRTELVEKMPNLFFPSFLFFSEGKYCLSQIFTKAVAYATKEITFFQTQRFGEGGGEGRLVQPQTKKKNAL